MLTQGVKLRGVIEDPNTMPDIRFGASGFIAAAQWTRKRLEEFSVPQPAGNRLSKAGDLIREVNDRKIVLTPDDDQTLYRVTEAQWTIFEQYIVARGLGEPGRALSGAQLAKLETMLSGADTENKDLNPLARNTQFELYTGATMTMGDVPTRIGEPDLRVDYLGLDVGVAAKRVRSAKQLVKRAKEAVEQIKSSGTPGIVALNVDVLLKAIGSGTADTEQLDERLAVLNEVDELLMQHDAVLGSLVFARDAAWQFGAERPVFGFSITHRFVIYPRTREQKERGEEFWRNARERIDQRIDNL